MAQIERKQGRLTYFGIAGIVIALLAGGAALYIGLAAKNDSATKSDVDALTKKARRPAGGGHEERKQQLHLRRHPPSGPPPPRSRAALRNVGSNASTSTAVVMTSTQAHVSAKWGLPWMTTWSP